MTKPFVAVGMFCLLVACNAKESASGAKPPACDHLEGSCTEYNPGTVAMCKTGKSLPDGCPKENRIGKCEAKTWTKFTYKTPNPDKAKGDEQNCKAVFEGKWSALP